MIRASQITLAAFVTAVACGSLFATDKPTAPSEANAEQAAELRRAAAADPTIQSAAAPPVRVYLAEQQGRRARSVAGLRRRIAEYQNDAMKKPLIPVLEEELAELERRPLEPVNFDAAYDYAPTTGLVGYSKRARLLENTAGGRSIIQVENIALELEGLGTSRYASGKFLRVDRAILVGPLTSTETVLGVKRPVYSATLVDLEALLHDQTGGTERKP